MSFNTLPDGGQEIFLAYRSTSLPSGLIFLHDIIQIPPSIKVLPTRIDEIVDVVSQRDEYSTISSRFDYAEEKNNQTLGTRNKKRIL